VVEWVSRLLLRRSRVDLCSAHTHTHHTDACGTRAYATDGAAALGKLPASLVRRRVLLVAQIAAVAVAAAAPR